MQVMKKTKTLFLVLLLILTQAATAQAWQLNHSFIDPKLINNTCAAGNPPLTPTGDPFDQQCCLEEDIICVDQGPNGFCYEEACAKWTTVTYQGHRRDIKVPITNGCYHPTCYMKVAQRIGVRDPYAQPLTKNHNVLLHVINSFYDVSGNIPNSFVWYNYTGDASVSWGGDWWENDSLHFPAYIDAATGTSAMQGLLWSWRFLDPSWRGVWKTPTWREAIGGETEDANLRATTLPSNENSKNIIFVTDGIDSDGPGYKNGTIPYVEAKDGQDDAVKDGTHSIGYRRPSYILDPMFETCDAHVPLASITNADYEAVCTKMKTQGIKVNVVFYLYASQDITNSPLKRCQEITEGIAITDATPANLQSKLAALLASIATKSIRLVK